MTILLTHVGVARMTEHEFTPPTEPTEEGVYETANGFPVRIYAVDGAAKNIHGAVHYGHGWEVAAWHGDDRSFLRDKPKPLECWVNVYPDYFSSVYDTKEESAVYADASFIIARLHIAQQSDGTFAIVDQKRFDK